MVDNRLRRHFDYYLGETEVIIYSALALLLAVTAVVTVATSGRILWIGLRHWTVAAQTLGVLNELLIVLMLVEILHTVRISIRSHVLAAEPFLVVGLIASIRRILVITLEAATLTKEGTWTSEGASGIFNSSMIELGLLGSAASCVGDFHHPAASVRSRVERLAGSLKAEVLARFGDVRCGDEGSQQVTIRDCRWLRYPQLAGIAGALVCAFFLSSFPFHFRSLE